MNVDELKSNLNNLKRLTENDIKRLNKMKNDEKFSYFHDVISYMLENGVKLEQELLD